MVADAVCQLAWIWDHLDVSGCAFEGISRVLTEEGRPTRIVIGTIHGLHSQTEQNWEEEEEEALRLSAFWLAQPSMSTTVSFLPR